ncbi:hypothetical protein [Domibacillus robiginosus]|uniref:hypothetical protein n=1 Tax=Domibacillus robiginosus TaxID=1071054 RepID=UPI00067AFA1F|nr:hypothetical protein [Domibacillus robiginosus]
MSPGLGVHPSFLKEKTRPYSFYTILLQATWRQEGSVDSCGTSGQLRPVEPPGAVGLSACATESGAARTPPIYPIHVTVINHLSTVW